VCELEWSELDAQYPKDDSGKGDLVKLCFSATYLSQFLNKGLGVGLDDQLRIQQTVGVSFFGSRLLLINNRNTTSTGRSAQPSTSQRSSPPQSTEDHPNNDNDH
jgi:hypothetical protein